MALWVLQVGVLDGLLPTSPREELAKKYKEDVELRRIQADNLIAQLLSETPKLDVADALLSTDAAVALAGQIAGIEFEQLASQRRHIGSLRDLSPRLRSKLRRARRIRNTAIHDPPSIRKADVEYLIAVAKELRSLVKRRT